MDSCIVSSWVVRIRRRPSPCETAPRDIVMLQSLLIAVQFLTVVPVRLNTAPSTLAAARSLLYYPLVGLCIGTLLAAVGWLLGDTPSLLGAAVLLAAWAAITGALHLDGLADTADAWVGGHGDRDKTLSIMKDPCSGPVAVVTLVLVLLLKFAALAQLLAHGAWSLIVLAPVIGRTAPLPLFLTTPYVGGQGLGSAFAARLPRRAVILMLAATLIAAVVALGIAAAWVLACATAVFAVLRRLMLRRIGGTTGDTAGALIEIVETAVLLTAAMLS